MLKRKFQERTVELIWAQEPSITLQFWFRSEMAQTSEQCCREEEGRSEGHPAIKGLCLTFGQRPSETKGLANSQAIPS